MPSLRIHDFLKDRILVSRESARLLAGVLGAMIAEGESPGSPEGGSTLTIDFQGIEGMAPSFLDELFTIFESLVGDQAGRVDRALIVLNPPARLSSKFEAVARGHGMLLRALADGSWLLGENRDEIISNP